MIRRIDGKWYVYSHDGKRRLSKGYATLKEAQRRLRQIEAFSKKLKKQVKSVFGGK